MTRTMTSIQRDETMLIAIVCASSAYKFVHDGGHRTAPVPSSAHDQLL